MALLHAKQNGFSKILLLDDDIRGLTPTLVQHGVQALEDFDIAGCFVDDFPDTSVLGHIEREIGIPLQTFLSGSCLFVRADRPVGFFAPIYNEDWILMAPAIARSRVCSLGTIRQLPYDPFENPETAAFQASGEIIADGLFGMLAANQYETRQSLSSWESILAIHNNRLAELARLADDERHIVALEAARATSSRIEAIDCLNFVEQWEADRALWADEWRNTGEL